MCGRRINNSVEENDRIFGYSRRSHNKIRKLPDYLKGTTYIQGAYYDKYFCGKTLFSFTALSTIDVYVMKHKKSVADYSGWELVKESFPVEPYRYYVGGADIYRKRFVTGEKVKIPGPKIRSWYGYGNMVFVKKAEGINLKVVFPAPGAPLYAGKQNVLFTRPDDIQPVSWKWEVQEADTWETAGLSQFCEYSAPWTTEDLPLRFRVTAVDDGGQVHTIEAVYTVVNKARVEICNPHRGETLRPEEKVHLYYKAYDVSGVSVSCGGDTMTAFYLKVEGDWTLLE